MNRQYLRGRTAFLAAGMSLALLAGSVFTAPRVYADIFPSGGKISSADKEQWVSIGMGVRTEFAAQQDASANGKNYSNNFGIQNARIYMNGQLNRYLKFEFNTDCFNCPSSINGGGGGNGSGGGTTASATNFFGGNSTVGVLDLIGKFEYNSYANLWVGRLLVPGERGELNGPFFHAVYDGFKTPFNAADFSGNFGKGGAGLYGRDNGAVYWGQVDPGYGHLQYSLGVFTGLQSSGTGCGGGPCGPNQSGSLMYAGRVTFNFLNPEKNPGYYTSGTYYGKSGDILALAAGFNHQSNGAGSYRYRSDLTIFTSDLLFEKLLPNDMGVLTINAEFKQHYAAYSSLAFTDTSVAGTSTGVGNNSGMFRGSSYTGYALYLFPQTVGIGRFQPYGRYTYIAPDHSSQRSEWEGGLNYVIEGFNSRVSAFWQNGDIATKGLFNYAQNVVGDKVNRFVLAYQFQY